MAINIIYTFEERAAIREFEANSNRTNAEIAAFNEIKDTTQLGQEEFQILIEYLQTLRIWKSDLANQKRHPP